MHQTASKTDNGDFLGALINVVQVKNQNNEHVFLWLHHGNGRTPSPGQIWSVLYTSLSHTHRMTAKNKVWTCYPKSTECKKSNKTNLYWNKIISFGSNVAGLVLNLESRLQEQLWTVSRTSPTMQKSRGLFHMKLRCVLKAALFEPPMKVNQAHLQGRTHACFEAGTTFRRVWERQQVRTSGFCIPWFWFSLYGEQLLKINK